ncbi:aromatic ring-hydroxylating dioxygenase subunit alpha [Rhodococcus koreensis]|uniref:aromatic ring-hydroxylating oxygenase subunit alpha n=1 Tax=Rhodococcus koreensis TaxID=99653 RepID=UPI00366C13D8
MDNAQSGATKAATFPSAATLRAEYVDLKCPCKPDEKVAHMTLMSAPAQPAGLPDVDFKEVDRLLDDGRTLPPQFYVDPAIAELEDRLIFRTSWQLACTELELKQPGDFVTLTLSGVPLVVVRDTEHQIRALVNVCRHRAGRVVEAPDGNCKRLQCQYHGWTYRLDGSLQGAPGFREGLPPFETLGLRSVSVDTWRGFVFVSLEPKQSLQEQLGEVPRVMEEAGYDFPFAAGGADGLEAAGDYVADMQANWKLYHENNSDCYHCPTTHQDSFCRILNSSGIHFEPLNGGSSFSYLPLSDELLAMCPSDEDRRKLGYVQYIIWPNTYVITGHVGELWFRLDPHGPGVTHVVGRVYRRPGQQSAEMTAILDEASRATVLEDKAMIEGVQIGLASGYYEPGPTLPGREEAVRRLQRDIWNALRPVFTT